MKTFDKKISVSSDQLDTLTTEQVSHHDNPRNNHHFHPGASQVPQPLLLVVGWVYNTPKTVKFFFASFHRVHLVTHWEKVIKIG